MDLTPLTDFASFWHGGPLNAFAYACLASFPDEGADLSLYSYDPRLEAPRGVKLLDARTICPDETLVARYLANGKPSIATFADMFRYRMIRETGQCWVDTDLVCLKTPDFAKAATISAGRRTRSAPCSSTTPCCVCRPPNPRSPSSSPPPRRRPASMADGARSGRSC